MKITPYLIAALLSLTLAQRVMASNDSPRVALWERKPISVTLSVGKETTVSFPQPILDLQVPAYVNDPVSRITLLPNGVLYWLAHETFDTVRVTALGADSQYYLLDVTSVQTTEDTYPVIIKDKPAIDARKEAERIERKIPYSGYDYIDLARFAAQHLYGPSRLIKALPGVTRMPITSATLSLFRGQDTTSTPVAQWRSPKPGYYVSAVRVVNTTQVDVALDPRHIRGQWLFATAHNNVLLPKGHYGDSTHVYLISDRPFHQSLSLATVTRSAHHDRTHREHNE